MKEAHLRNMEDDFSILEEASAEFSSAVKAVECAIDFQNIVKDAIAAVEMETCS